MVVVAYDADLQDESVSMQWSVVANSLYMLIWGSATLGYLKTRINPTGLAHTMIRINSLV